MFLSTLLVGGLALALVFGAEPEPPVYAMPVRGVLAQPSSGVVRVTGWMPVDSLCRANADCDYRFALVDHEALDASSAPSIEVRYLGCSIPDSLLCCASGSELSATVEGTITGPSGLQASRLLVKCPGKYEICSDCPPREMRAIPNCP